MNPFKIDIYPCEVQRWDDDFIPAEMISKSEELQDMEAQVKQRIQESLRAAHQQREDAKEQARKIVENARIEANEKMVQWREEAHQQAADDAIQWVKNEAEFEASLLSELKHTISEQIYAVIKHWATDQNIAPIVAGRLTDEVLEKVGTDSVTMMVSTADYKKISETLGDQLVIKVDSSLEPNCAELHSKALTAQIDLSAHMNALLEAFVVKSDKLALDHISDELEAS
ncbi:MAG: hypothetical protein ACPGUD_03340 [Parashewanella sp.]